MLGGSARDGWLLQSQSVPVLARTANQVATAVLRKAALTDRLIVHADQIKPVRRRDLTARGSIARGKRGG